MLLALYAVDFRGGIRCAFENSSHDVYFSNKKSVENALFTEIGHHEDRACNELLKTYDGKFCLEFFSLTAVRSDSGQF